MHFWHGIYTLFSEVKTKIKCIDPSTYYEHYNCFNMTNVYLYIVSYRIVCLYCHCTSTTKLKKQTFKVQKTIKEKIESLAYLYLETY